MARTPTSSAFRLTSGDRTTLAFSTTSIVIILVASLSSWGFARAAEVDADSTLDSAELVSEVSGERMMDSIRELQDFGTRAFYLDNSVEVAQYLQGRLSGLGLEVRLDEFMAGNHSVANVVATKTGTSSSASWILVGAHYDSENMGSEDYALGAQLPAPGADDDASGVASVLELARVVSNQQMDCTVQFVLFAAEENGYDHSGGLAGSGHFASEEKAKGTSYKATAVLDMIGYRGSSENHLVAVVNNDDSSIVDSIKSGINTHNINLTLSVVRDPMARYSDHYSFWTAGYPSVLFIEADDSLPDYAYSPHYHSANDTVDILSEEQISEVTKAVLGGILGLVDLRDRTNTLLIVLALSGTALVALTVIYLYSRSRKVGRT